jgi:hypothetical protein
LFLAPAGGPGGAAKACTQGAMMQNTAAADRAARMAVFMNQSPMRSGAVPVFSDWSTGIRAAVLPGLRLS